MVPRHEEEEVLLMGVKIPLGAIKMFWREPSDGCSSIQNKLKTTEWYTLKGKFYSI